MMNTKKYMILGSGIALGVFVPALSLKLQLESEGHRADLLCVEELYSGKDDVMEETRKSFLNFKKPVYQLN